MASSPRPWGCFFVVGAQQALQPVFPTPVGVFPADLTAVIGLIGLPHARGGVSFLAVCHREHRRSSPRPWGCFF